MNEETKSCGCLVGKKSGRTKFNKYEIIGNIAYISLDNTSERAICDKDKVEELKKYCWHISRKRNRHGAFKERMWRCALVSSNDM